MITKERLTELRKSRTHWMKTIGVYSIDGKTCDEIFDTLEALLRVAEAAEKLNKLFQQGHIVTPTNVSWTNLDESLQALGGKETK